ncbi:membrane protein insertion efficiency factor YidD [Schleiferiaceae bacterium]|nr:membrane protein insertion efficiency factor YidD [Flavobacteriales bacterium]MDC1022429.1 membrane protein insertion efficiency factor YidD [Schleiferiaceae bacterium]
MEHPTKSKLKLLSNIFGFPLLLIIWVYRRLISPFTGPACRYTPTCSAYAQEAVKLHGPFKGFVLSIKRIASCNPWGGHGWDPVPGSDLEQQLKDNTP